MRVARQVVDEDHGPRALVRGKPLGDERSTMRVGGHVLGHHEGDDRLAQIVVRRRRPRPPPVTAGCASSASSTSPAPTRKPPVLIRSVDARPTIRCRPSASIVATSPVRNQPSAVNASTDRRPSGIRRTASARAPAARRVSPSWRAVLADQPGRHREANPPWPAAAPRPPVRTGDQRLRHPVALDRVMPGQPGKVARRPTPAAARCRRRAAARRVRARAAAGSAHTRHHTVGTPK